mmetsp:Transcript_131398/g.227512  ORF Transcript_131398/g.227512 Transcript_131398/m.227512 type:complete len:203 (-) Transcript_131398:337-945(-)
MPEHVQLAPTLPGPVPPDHTPLHHHRGAGASEHVQGGAAHTGQQVPLRDLPGLHHRQEAGGHPPASPHPLHPAAAVRVQRIRDDEGQQAHPLRPHPQPEAIHLQPLQPPAPPARRTGGLRLSVVWTVDASGLQCPVRPLQRVCPGGQRLAGLRRQPHWASEPGGGVGAVALHALLPPRHAQTVAPVVCAPGQGRDHLGAAPV